MDTTRTLDSGDFDLNAPYKPVALYLEDADTLEYVREDVTTLSERVDDFLTLVLAMDGREPIGFRLKGFANFYMKDRQRPTLGEDFYSLVGVLERMFSEVGTRAFQDDELLQAYKMAWKIALEDRVTLHDLPRLAA